MNGASETLHDFVLGVEVICANNEHWLKLPLQRQTVVSQFFQLDKLVVEGGKSVSQLHRPYYDWWQYMELHPDKPFYQGKQSGNEGGIVRQTTE